MGWVFFWLLVVVSPNPAILLMALLLLSTVPMPLKSYNFRLSKHSGKFLSNVFSHAKMAWALSQKRLRDACLYWQKHLFLHSASLSVCLCFYMPKGKRQEDSSLQSFQLILLLVCCWVTLHTWGSHVAGIVLEIHTDICLSLTGTLNSLWDLQWEEQMFWDNDFWLFPAKFLVPK